MLSALQKKKIREFRREGFTYTEIQKAMGIIVPKSTLSYICKGASPNIAYAGKIRLLNQRHLQRVRIMALTRNRLLHEARLQRLAKKADKTVCNADKNALKIALAMLYLGEGSKWASHRGLSLGNSNPDIICLYISLLSTCYNILSTGLHARVQCRADQDIRELEEYWSKTTDIPLINFYKAGIDKRTIGIPTKKPGYRGVCVIICPGTEIQLELAAIANSLQIKTWGCSSVG